MKIIVNGNDYNLDKVITIQELLSRLSLKKELVAVEVNKNILKKEKYEDTAVNDGDKIEIVHFVGGG